MLGLRLGPESVLTYVANLFRDVRSSTDQIIITDRDGDRHEARKTVGAAAIR